jgi:Protein of unknown function (DUF3592)/GYF domain 2
LREKRKMERQPYLWRARINGTEYPAQDFETLRQWAQQGRLGRDDSVWDPHASEWKLSRDIAELRNVYYPPVLLTARWKYDLFLQIWPLCFVMLALLGLLLLSGSIGTLADTLRALPWSSTQGHIVQSTVSTVPDSFPPPNGVTRTFYRPEIIYEYQVSGRTYQSTRLQIDSGDPDLFSDRQAAEQLTAPHHPGDSVIVYFDPKNPQTATLDRNQINIVMFCVGLAFTAIAFYVLRLWWRKSVSRKSALASAAALTPKFCSNCGYALKGRVSFCSGCGAPMEPSLLRP